jgi:hypothetical protein
MSDEVETHHFNMLSLIVEISHCVLILTMKESYIYCTRLVSGHKGYNI